MTNPMNRVVRFYEQGPPEVLRLERAETGSPGPGEIRVRHTAIGVNYHDIYNRSGLYPVKSLPEVPGIEAAGVVEELGQGVTHVQPGDRVVYISPRAGSYRDEGIAPSAWAVRIPPGVTDIQAGGSFLRGLTAEFLVNRIRPPEPGSTLLIQAVAGGVGLILCQWLKHLGCTVIGTTSSDEKAALAAAHGCDHLILYNRENFVERVREITGGEGVPIVYDAVGKDTLLGSLDCLRPRGLLINYGQSSGAPAPLHMSDLARRGSLMVTRPLLWDFFRAPGEFEDMAGNFFDLVARHKITCHVKHVYALADVVTAHRDVEARKTAGGVVLAP